MQVLGRIPEASIRALYAERVGRRLGITASRILEDVERIGTGQPAKLEDRGLSQPRTGQIAMGASTHLLGMLWHRPQLIVEVRDRYKVRRDDFLDPVDSELYQAMLERAPERISPSDLSPLLSQRLEELPRGDFPELEEKASEARLQRSLADSVKRIRIESLENGVASLRRQLAELSHHREGEGPQLAAELDRKQRRIDALRRSGAMEA
jgi:hypothetical protein